MDPPARYYDLIREMRDRYDHRLCLVQCARQHGIKTAARAFATTVPTVRKWLRRYRQQGPSGLLERSRAPHHQPRKTPAEIEQRVVALREQLPTFGARRLIRGFDLPLSHRALERIWRERGLLTRRRRKYQRKQDLAAVKATWRLSSTPLARCGAGCSFSLSPRAAVVPPARRSVDAQPALQKRRQRPHQAEELDACQEAAGLGPL